jgi:hypothetical protein
VRNLRTKNKNIENKSHRKKVEEKIREPSKPSQPDLKESQPESAKKGPKGPHVPKKVPWPVKGMVNAYGFIHLSSDILLALQIPKGMKTDITFDLNADGNLTIAKGWVEPEKKKEGEKKNAQQS